VLISNEILQDDKNLLLGCVYIPPENSKYASKEGFSEIEDEIHTQQKYDKTSAIYTHTL
jgi:hypothetical protein